MRHVPLGALYTDYAKGSTIISEIVLTICVIFYMVWEFNEASTTSFTEYFSQFWGFYDMINFATFIVAYAFRWATYDRAKGLNFPPANERFVNFESSAWSVQMWRNVLAVNLVVCYLKMFKYVMQIPSLAHLFNKIFFTMKDILYLLICFAFIFWGFALSHFLAYGDEVAAFRTIPDTMIMLWRQMLGDLAAVDDMISANRILGPFFFVIFSSSVSIVLLAIFLGLLRESYVIRFVEHRYTHEGVIRPAGAEGWDSVVFTKTAKLASTTVRNPACACSRLTLPHLAATTKTTVLATSRHCCSQPLRHILAWSRIIRCGTTRQK